MKCIHCQKETKNPKFCSRSCSAKTTNKTPKRKLTKTCNYCDSIVRNYKSSLCENHWREKTRNKKEDILNKTLGECREKNKLLHASSLHVSIRGYARSWFKDLIEMPCAHCGYDKHVELHHIKSIASFSDDSLVKEVNSKENIIPLCPNCHWEIENL